MTKSCRLRETCLSLFLCFFLCDSCVGSNLVSSSRHFGANVRQAGFSSLAVHLVTHWDNCKKLSWCVKKSARISMDDFYRLCIHQNWTDIQSNSCRVDKTGSVTFLRWFILQNWTDNAWSRRSHLVYYVVWRAKIDKVWIQAWVALQSKTVWLSSRWMNLSSRWMWSFIPPPRTAKLVNVHWSPNAGWERV